MRHPDTPALRSPRLHRMVPGILALGILLAAALPGRADDPAAEVRATAQALFARVEAIRSDETASPDERRARMEAVFGGALDHGVLASSALGPLRERFTREQYADFAREYARHLTDVFTRVAVARTGERHEITEVRWDPDREHAVVVATGPLRMEAWPGAVIRPTRSKGKARTELVMRRRHGAWRIVSVTLGSVHVSSNFRSQFEAFLQREDPDALIAELARRNRANAENNPFAE